MTGPPDTTADETPPPILETIRWAVGLLMSLSYLYIAFLSLQTDFTLDPSVSLTVFGMSMALMFGLGPLTKLAYAWRGNGGHSNGNRDD